MNTASWSPTEMTMEVWFKADDITSGNNQVILGATPYKLRKKSGVSRL
jgi:hypothetical protein